MTDIVEKYSSYVLGIDLGTTNCAAGFYKKGNTEIININGTKTMPSVMSVLKDGEILVGSQAKSRSLIAPDSTVMSIKRHMATDWTKEFEEIPGKVFTPVEVSAEILLKLIDGVQQNETIDLGGTPKYAVICVPANFNDAQKKATKMAAELAHLETITLLEEPIAAAYAYAIEKERVQTVLVYDLGGGTFDVSILEVDSTGDANKQFKVLAKEGIQKLGGDDFDQRIIEKVAGEFAKASNIDIFDLDKDQGINSKKIREAQQKLLEAVIVAKHELSETTKTTIDIPIDHPPCPCSKEVVEALDTAAREMGIKTKRMNSGAGHDAQNMAAKVKTGMLFVPSVKGISHSPMEWTKRSRRESGRRSKLSGKWESRFRRYPCPTRSLRILLTFSSPRLRPAPTWPVTMASTTDTGQGTSAVCSIFTAARGVKASVPRSSGES